MGRYADKITIEFSEDPNRPTFEETLKEVRIMNAKAFLKQLTPQQRMEFIRIGKEAGLIT